MSGRTFGRRSSWMSGWDVGRGRRWNTGRNLGWSDRHGWVGRWLKDIIEISLVVKVGIWLEWIQSILVDFVEVTQAIAISVCIGQVGSQVGFFLVRQTVTVRIIVHRIASKYNDLKKIGQMITIGIEMQRICFVYQDLFPVR